MRNDFKPDEISNISGKDYPKVGGRLRLFHTDIDEIDGRENGHASGVKTEIFKYDDDVAVVTATVSVGGDSFSGIGMASKDRDKRLFPAILELAETRAIARALRFAGYGVEYTGAEEMSHTKNVAEDNVRKDTVPDPVPHKEGSEIQDPAGKLKSDVWTYILSEWGSLGKDKLAGAIKLFIANLKEKRPGILDSQIYTSILNRKEEFAESFRLLLKDDDVQEEDPETDERRKEYEAEKVRLVEQMNTTVEDQAPSKSERRKKAEIFMKLPEGVNAQAFNMMLEGLMISNSSQSTEAVYDMILQDFDAFVDMMVSYCAEHSIDPGFHVEGSSQKGLVKPEPLAENGKKSYTEFRAKWINLTWKPFCKFIIEESQTFHEDKDEYDAAVEKFDRLKEKNGSADLVFPYIFSHTESPVDSSKSILSDKSNGDWATMKKIGLEYPGMCKKVSEVIGILVPKDEQELEMFLDEFEHQMTTYEAKHNKPYSETKGE